MVFRPKLKWLALVTAAMLLAGLIGLWPVKHWRTVTEGTDAYEAHHALYGERVKSREFTVIEPIRGVGLKLVYLRRTGKLASVEVEVMDINGRMLGEGKIAGAEMVDDKFAVADFGKKIAGKGDRVVINVKASEAVKEEAVGARFDLESGQLALGVVERVSVGKWIGLWAANNKTAAEEMILVTLGGMVVAFLLWLGEVKVKRVEIGVIMVMVLAAVTVLMRLPVALKIDSAYGGDAFNYLLKSWAWIEGEDPFAADFRKAPLMPLLIMPGLLPWFDPLWFGRAVSMAAAAGTVAVLTWFARRVGIGWPWALAAGALLAANREFWWESAHGLANVVFTLMIWLAFLAFTYCPRYRGAYLTSAWASLAALTRFEGALIGIILVPVIWWYHQGRRAVIVKTIVPAAILLSIPFLLTPLTGEIGVRTPGDIAGDGGLYLARSAADLSANWQSATLFWGRAWVLVETVGNQWLWFGIGIALGLATLSGQKLELVSKILPPPLTPPPAFVKASSFAKLRRTQSAGRRGGGGSLLRLFLIISIWPWLVWVVLQQNSGADKVFSQLISAIIGFGLSVLLIKYPKVMIPAAISLALVLTAVVVILPKTRYFLPVLPLMALGIAAAFQHLGRLRLKVVQALVLVLAGSFIMFVYVDSRNAMPGAISDYNEKSGDLTVLTAAARWLRQQGGRVALAEERDLPFRVYLPAGRRLILKDDGSLGNKEKLKLIQEQEIEWLVETEFNPFYQGIIEEYPDSFRKVMDFNTKYSEKSATVYEVAAQR